MQFTWRSGDAPQGARFVFTTVRSLWNLVGAKLLARIQSDMSILTLVSSRFLKIIRQVILSDNETLDPGARKFYQQILNVPTNSSDLTMVLGYQDVSQCNGHQADAPHNITMTSQWVSWCLNHQKLDGLFSYLFKLISKKTCVADSLRWESTGKWWIPFTRGR